jgi:heat shock protein HtpX
VVDEVARRNRRRIAVVAVASVLNQWLSIVVLLAIPVALLTYFGRSDSDDPLAVGPMALATALVSVPWAVLWVSEGTRTVRSHVVRAVGGVEVGPEEAPRVHNLLAELAIATGTPPVTVAVVDDPAPNAMAVGRRPGATTVVVTSGLVEKLTRDELEAVLAVEMCAVRRLDTALRSVTMAATAAAFQVHNMVRGDVAPGRAWYERWDWWTWLVVAITWPNMLFAALIRRWAQRSSDFGADQMAVAVTRHPDALVSALRTLQADVTAPVATRQPPLFAMWLPPVGPAWVKPVDDGEGDVPHEVRSLMARPDLQQRLDRLAVGSPVR